MNVKQLRDKLNSLPKAFDDVRFGAYDDEYMNTKAIVDTLFLTANSDSEDGLFLVPCEADDAYYEHRDGKKIQSKPTPIGENEKLLDYLAEEIQLVERVEANICGNISTEAKEIGLKALHELREKVRLELGETK